MVLPCYALQFIGCKSRDPIIVRGVCVGLACQGIGAVTARLTEIVGEITLLVLGLLLWFMI